MDCEQKDPVTAVKHSGGGTPDYHRLAQPSQQFLLLMISCLVYMP
jgi:hypothetical protein